MSGSQTVYVHRLPEKMNLDRLKMTLYHAFSAYGNVIEIHASKRNKLRGQAWIVFEDASGAARAVNGMNGQPFAGRIIEATFATNKSNVIAKADGTYTRPTRNLKRKRPEAEGEMDNTSEKKGMSDGTVTNVKNEGRSEGEPSAKRVALSGQSDQGATSASSTASSSIDSSAMNDTVKTEIEAVKE